MTKPFLILQLRPEDLAADDEFNAFLQSGKISHGEARRIRMDRDPLPHINVQDYSGVIVGGGPSNISDSEEKKNEPQKQFEPWLHKLLDQIVEQDHPYLGACFGLGALAAHLGGKVSKEKYSEEVKATTIKFKEAAKADPLLTHLPSEFRAYSGHKEACQELPPGAVHLGSSDACPIHMIRLKQNIYATQFHPEADSEVFARRIDVYRHAGYFPPDEADVLMEAALKEHITIPKTILQRFVERYRTA